MSAYLVVHAAIKDMDKLKEYAGQAVPLIEAAGGERLFRKTGERSREILEYPTPDNVVLALVYRIEQENFADVIDLDKDKCDLIPPQVYKMLDGWIRESLPEFFNNVLSLPPGSERDEAKRILKNRMETLVDKNLKRTLYSVCRSLKVLN